MSPSSRRSTGDPSAAAAAPPRVLHALAIDLEPATAELVSLWLAAQGWSVNFAPGHDDTVSLILAEMAFPRRADQQRLHALAAAWPGVPVIVLSPTFFADVPRHGDVARQLGVAAVLATPVTRDSLVAAIDAVLGPAA